MPHLHEVGRIHGAQLQAGLVHCDGVDHHPREEDVVSPRAWFVLRGRFALDGSAGRGIADPASALRLRPGRPFVIRHPDGGDVVLSVSGRVAEEAVERRDGLTPLSDASYLSLGSIARRLAAKDDVEPVEMEDAVASALAEDAATRGATLRERRIADAIDWTLHATFDERHSLVDLATPHGLSTFALSRAYRRARGAPVHRSLLRLRLRHALALLLDTSWTMARVAAECGFASHAHLTTRFHRAYGTTPREARRTGGASIRVSRSPRRSAKG